jgi:hypothetical protein
LYVQRASGSPRTAVIAILKDGASPVGTELNIARDE